MGELRVTVDHLRLNYEGPFDAHELYKHLTNFIYEKGFDFRPDKEFEHELQNGKHIEWLLRPWKQISHDMRQIVKMKVLIYNYKKVDAIVNNKKTKIGNGKLVMYFDGYIDFDQWNMWEHKPFLQFIRTAYLNFVHKTYTEHFEQRLTSDVNYLYHSVEKFLNMHKHYKVVSKVSSFASTVQ
ncbi:hypothetical protein ISS07_01175 [Candidatus Woesearchaeota archaeon]|nr:hypothetical protein [Candidatus Woesearchaeota archaeon]